MFKFYYLIFILFFYSASSIAQLTQQNQNCVCNKKIGDRYESPKSFSFGKFNGQCIDSCRFRPAQIITEISTATKTQTDFLEVANILHYGSYYKSKIRINDIESVEVGFENFAPAIHHVFLKFNFKKNGKLLDLHSQENQKTKRQIHPPLITQSLVISPEGVPPQNQKYNLFDGFMKNYLLVYRIVTADEMKRWTGEHKHVVKIFPLNLSAEQARKIFSLSLKTSSENGYENIYQLFTNNCSTSSLGLIDSVIETKNSSLLDSIEDSLPLSGPFGTLKALYRRHVIPNQITL